MEFLKNAFLFLGGFLNVAILLTIAIVVILVLWARRRGGPASRQLLVRPFRASPGSGEPSAEAKRSGSRGMIPRPEAERRTAGTLRRFFSSFSAAGAVDRTSPAGVT
ncbi:hypothetical protein [Paenibacillus sp. P22]|uniref:hypothetical protein n=1 Tax=Paenibacillus sp. P22 TaxID=483908 RepID=UPI0004359F2E|nr:hypothetical protein [Paenibacillus sp. P22]CDN46127.1 hypothetical protein BN871_KT_00030 [Paenibacillus sp. P22]